MSRSRRSRRRDAREINDIVLGKATPYGCGNHMRPSQLIRAGDPRHVSNQPKQVDDGTAGDLAPFMVGPETDDAASDEPDTKHAAGHLRNTDCDGGGLAE